MIGLAVMLSILMVVKHFVSFMSSEEKSVERRLDPNWVRGAAVMSGEIPYTLNFDQENTLINIINQSEPHTDAAAQVKFPLSKIVIYRFAKEPEIEIIAKGAVGSRIVYQAEPISKGVFLIEKEEGSLRKLINSAINTTPLN